MKKRSYFYLIALLLLLVLMFIFTRGIGEPKKDLVTNFIECEQAGFPIQETYPRVCLGPDGHSYSEELVLEGEEQPLIISGTFLCLPLIDPEAPHHDLCYFGLLSDALDYYDLVDYDLAGSNLASLRPDDKIEVWGLFQEQSHPIYQSIGQIKVDRVKLLD